MDLIPFKRKPYTVTYKDFHTGELKHVRRRPPQKQHEMLPTDVVELSTKRGDDWEAGDEFAIKHVSYRAPNIIQLKNDEGATTFVPYFELSLEEGVAYRDKPGIDNVQSNRYLRWP